MTRAGVRRIPPLVIGLTGGVGCGKSVIAGEFAKRGAVIISGDQVGHDVVDQDPYVRQRLVRWFGSDILSRQRVDRRKLAERAFSNPAGTAKLNNLVHPALVAELRRRVRAARRRPAVSVVVVDAALLVEWKNKVPVDVLVAVWASRENRRRWLSRREWPDAEIRGRMRAQVPFSARRAVADIVVRNDGDLAALRRKAGRLWQKLREDR